MAFFPRNLVRVTELNLGNSALKTGTLSLWFLRPFHSCRGENDINLSLIVEASENLLSFFIFAEIRIISLCLISKTENKEVYQYLDKLIAGFGSYTGLGDSMP